MANPYDYIVFESDQVLTDKDLNKTFEYLDQQDRWTRNKLIGIGIVCGLDIIRYTGVIEITKGCGVTSQGYLITLPHGYYKNYIPYTVPVQPIDPLFEYPNTDLPFYQPFYKDKDIYLLITDDDLKKLDTDERDTALPLTSAGFLNDYAVVLFLEATEADLKNCDMFDCNNNGKQIAFDVKPLLVAKNDLPGIISGSNGTTSTGTQLNIAHEIRFKRFNVPYASLTTANDIVNAFANLVDDFTLTRVANAYIYSYEKYKLLLGDDGNPFSGLYNQLKSQRDTILKTNPVFIQYFYDYVDDLIKAYYEFTVKISGIISACCPDENLFPLHLILGDASKNTDEFIADAYRQYFIFSPLFDKKYSEVSEGVFLYDRMKLLAKEFLIWPQQTFAGAAIKITPSQYEHLWLSQRAIPYYYTVNETNNELYKSWSQYKTSRGNDKYNLGYNAYLYNTNEAVMNPLLYDIEFYNFFRIEGHIGKNYTDVLNDIVSQIQTYNLPVDVVAVQAGGDDTTITDDEPQCSFQDLNTLFNVLRSDLYCLLGKLMCYAASQTYNPYIIFTPFPIELFERTRAGAADPEKVAKEAKAPGAEETKAAASPEHISSTASKAVFSATAAASATNTSASSTAANQMASSAFLNINLFNFLFFYQKGTFLKQQPCFVKLATTSVGKYYAAHPPSGTYFFTSFDPKDLSHNFLTIVDLIEEIISTLYFTTLSSLNVDTFSAKLGALQNYLLQLNEVFLQFEASKGDDNYFIDFEEHIDLFDDIVESCFDARFSSLKTEYNARVKLIKQQMLFPNYYEKHRGMEHKAGVPKGGTFIIVYNAPAPKSTTTTGFQTAGNIDVSDTGASAQAMFTKAELTRRLQFSFSDEIAQNQDFINLVSAALASSSASAAPPLIGDNIVIADFYIPYQCCSDCVPVTFVLPPKDDVLFDMQPNRFLFDDEHNYPFTAGADVTPGDFNSTTNPNNLNLLMDDNKLSLHPAMDIDATLDPATLTYKTKTINITIVKPDASFTINVITDATGQQILVQLTAIHTDGTNYEWLINEEENIFENKANPVPVPLNSFPDASEFTIELIITYVINDNTSSDDKSAVFKRDELVSRANKGPFNPFQNTSGGLRSAAVKAAQPLATEKAAPAAKSSATVKAAAIKKTAPTKKPPATIKKRNKKP